MKITWFGCACINAISATINLTLILMGGSGVEHKILFGVTFFLMLVSLFYAVVDD